MFVEIKGVKRSLLFIGLIPEIFLREFRAANQKFSRAKTY
jgi:hypothetical protein